MAEFLAALDYYEETSYSTAFIWGGLTVNPPISVTIQIVRVGDIVNLYIPEIIYNNPGVHIDVIIPPLHFQLAFDQVLLFAGSFSTIIYNIFANTPAIVGQLGEFNISPSGIITFGLPGDALGVQRITSTIYVYVDINTITYNINDGLRTCKTWRL